MARDRAGEKASGAFIEGDQPCGVKQLSQPRAGKKLDMAALLIVSGTRDFAFLRERIDNSLQSKGAKYPRIDFKFTIAVGHGDNQDSVAIHQTRARSQHFYRSLQVFEH